MPQPRQPQAVVPVVPFVAAAHEHTEPAFVQTVTPGTSQQQFEFDIPSFGYLRHLWFDVVGSGGSGGNAAADAPWNVLDQIQLLDTNGAPIFGPLDGFAAMLSNKLGAYAFQSDPATVAGFSGTGPNFTYSQRIPVEISHYDAFGSIANQNAAAPYKVRFSVNTIANIWATAPSTVPSLTIRGYAECWSLPNETDPLGRPQAQVPPNHGTVQYWSSRRDQYASGNNTVQVFRVGNLIRNLVFVARDTNGVRSDSVFPDPIILNWDARQQFNHSQRYHNALFTEKLSGSPTRPTGVFWFPMNTSVLNHAGDDKPTLYYPTVQATRLEVTGNTAATGTIQVITNDIAPVEVNPAERYVETSRTGFQPNPDAMRAGG